MRTIPPIVSGQATYVGDVRLPDFDKRSPLPPVRTGYVDHATAVTEMRDATVLVFYVAPASRATSAMLTVV